MLGSLFIQYFLIIYQVSQRLSKWRSGFGSATIAILNAFFNDNDEYRESNDMRQGFAMHMLDKLRFVYRHAKGNDPKVHVNLFYNVRLTKHDLCRNSVASFVVLLSCRLSPLTSMLFRVRNGSMGSMKGIHHRRLVQHLAWQPLRYVITHISNLLLIYTQVERVLMLWSSGNLTIEIVQEAKDAKKAIKLPIMINPVTGRQSVRYSAFSEVSWGKPTRSFIKSTKNLADEAVEVIMDEAKDFARVSRCKDEVNDDVDSEDDRANLEDGSDGELSAMTTDT